MSTQGKEVVHCDVCGRATKVCESCVTRGSHEDFHRFDTELDRLKDFAEIFCAITCDYDGYETAEGLKKLVDELTEMVYETIVEGRSVYATDEDLEEAKKAAEAAGHPCPDCALTDKCPGPDK